MTTNRRPIEPVVVVGAGLCGLSVAYRLERAGLRPRIVDSAPRIAESWRRRHPQLRLNTHRRFSRLPGRPLPRSAGAFASRAAVIAYLECYAGTLRAPIDHDVRVERIDRDDGRWRLRTTAGELKARHVVMATGRERVPILPPWPGRERYAGRLLHAADFGDVERYRGRSILVVGAGNSGVDVLNHLVRLPPHRVWLSVRRGTTVVPTRLLGMPVQRLAGIMSWLPVGLVDRLLQATEYVAFGNLRRHGLPRREVGPATLLAREGVAPAIDDGFVAALKAGDVTLVPAVARFDEDAVVLADGARLQPDVVVCATGYSPGLEQVVGHLGVLDNRGIPRRQGEEPALPGLWFLGMQPRIYGGFHAARRDSRRLAVRISRDLA